MKTAFPESVRKTARWLALTLLALVGSGLTLTTVASPAQAQDYYRFWVYFHVEDGGYVPSSEGVGTYVPEDGTLEAFRWAAPESQQMDSNPPRVDLGTVTFDTLCGGTEAPSGQKRVALLVDFGVDADAEGQAIPEPRGECAVVPEDATTLQALDEVAETRTDKGLLCAIDGFPTEGCGGSVKTATPADEGFVTVALPGADTEAAESAQQTEDEGTSTLVFALLGVVLIALIAGGVFLARRKNRP